MVLPCDVAGTVLAAHPGGRCSLIAFYNAVLAGPMASIDPLEVARYTPLCEWWRLASTALAAGASVVAQDALVPGTP